jgi:hypothetical protein
MEEAAEISAATTMQPLALGAMRGAVQGDEGSKSMAASHSTKKELTSLYICKF